MDQRSPWCTIQQIHRLFLLIELLFIVGCISVAVFSPEKLTERCLFVVWATLAPFALIAMLWPAPCPRCGGPFLMFSFANMDKAVGFAYRSMFNPFRYLMAFLGSSLNQVGSLASLGGRAKLSLPARR